MPVGAKHVKSRYTMKEAANRKARLARGSDHERTETEPVKAESGFMTSRWARGNGWERCSGAEPERFSCSAASVCRGRCPRGPVGVLRLWVVIFGIVRANTI